jgi:hypothetical protein
MRVYNDVGIDVSKDIAKELGCPYWPEAIMLKISFGDNNNRTKGSPYTYFLYCTHGYGTARTSGAKIMKAERLISQVDADCYIVSHDHTELAEPVAYLVPDPRTHIDKATGFTVGKFKEKKKLVVKSGAFLKWGGYAQMGGFPPSILGTPKITLSGQGKPNIKVEI